MSVITEVNGGQPLCFKTTRGLIKTRLRVGLKIEIKRSTSRVRLLPKQMVNIPVLLNRSSKAYLFE
jgi:hypothetical protein